MFLLFYKKIKKKKEAHGSNWANTDISRPCPYSGIKIKKKKKKANEFK
jgi:hypothetical protein